MRAAHITAIGEPPRAADVTEPTPGDGEVLIDMLAVSLNPVDNTIALGMFYAGHPPVPYVPGIEAVGRDRAGRLVYASGGGRGVATDGLAAERFAFPAELAVELPEEADPAGAAALGVAGLAGWLPLSWRAKLEPGETVLVLGATGTAGGIAVQAARHLGAGRVVAAGRNAARLAELEAHADAVVSLEGDDVADRLQEACGAGADVIYDSLWGEVTVAALEAAAFRARVVQMGAASRQPAAIPPFGILGKQLTVMGYSNFGVPAALQVETYRALVDLMVAGDLSVPVETVPLSEVGRAWAGLQAGGAKYVLVP